LEYAVQKEENRCLILMFINQADSEQLNQIRQAINEPASIDKIIELCQTLSHQVTDRQFPLTYAGILLASKARISDSIRVLKLCPARTFNAVLADYLEETQAFIPAAQVFHETAPYDVWTQTDLYKSQMAGTLDALAAFAQRTPPPPSNTYPTILDIGPGNGVLLVEIIKRLSLLYHLEGIHLILIEQSPKMLAAAQKYCQESLTFPLEFTPISCPIQKITPRQLARLEKPQQIWFINASLSLHHLSREMKIPTMKKLVNLSPHFLISEANYNHDCPQKDTPELIYSVTENYGLVMQDILKSSASKTQQKLCINNFLLTEAINILKNEREHRGDYHALIPEWQEIAKQGGWNVVKTTPTVSLPERIFTFTMELQGTNPVQWQES
jgi:SAM-dependent methyltransferase